MRSQRFSECGLLLMVALLAGCTTGVSSTGGNTKVGNDQRVGGQAGMEERLEKGRVVPHSPSERVGGQAGFEKPLEEGTVMPSDSGGRVGGQSGQEPPVEK